MAIKKVLIANRGEIVLRVARSCRELGVATVGVYSDADANAAHVREVDEAYLLGAAAPSESYLNQDKILEVAKKSGADAIHPGYGFLSENTTFADACADAGLIFVGPGADAIRLMGDKAAARQHMAQSGVPVLPGFDREGADDATLIAEADKVVRQIREDILTGRHEAGTRLPGERELSTQLGVSRLTLRSAIARLEGEGLVRAVHGSGNLVLPYREHGGIELLGYLAELSLQGRALDVGVLGELLELRRAIAIEALGLAAERGTDEEIANLRAHVEAQREVVDRPRELMEMDLAFARLVVRATHNIAFEREGVFQRLAEYPAVAAFFRPFEQALVQIAAIIGGHKKRCEIPPVPQGRIGGLRVLAHDFLDAVGLRRCERLVGAVKERCEPIREPGGAARIGLGPERVEARGLAGVQGRVAPAIGADRHLHPKTVIEDEDPRPCATGLGHQEGRQHRFA